MDQVKEDYEIVVRELNKAREVKDISFGINTSQSGNAGFITEEIKGELDAMIISSSQPVQIKVSLDEYENIVLFEFINFSGERYLPLRVGAMAESAENYRDSPEKWILNNKLKFEVSGALNSQVNFVVRYR